MDSSRQNYLAQIAAWYYEQNLSQDEIGRRIGRTRSMVSRLLREAREQGLVEIRVRYPLKTDSELESRLCRTFGLARAVVLAEPPADYDTLLRRLGELGAGCLQQYLHDGVQIGISWGTAVYHVVSAMPELPIRDARVIQMIGGVGSGDPLVDGTEIARWLAQKLKATYRILHAPLLVEDETVAQGLLNDRTITETLALVSQIEVALVGVGIINPPHLSALRRSGYASNSDMAMLRQAKVVGDVLARPLDACGRVVDTPFNRRVIGADLDMLKAIPAVILVAGGVMKAQAILATLRGGCEHVLVTDAETASAVLALHTEGSN